MSTPSLALAAPVPEEWQTWDSPFAYPTIDDLLTEMHTKVCCATLHAPTEAAILEAENRFIETRSFENFHAAGQAHEQRSIAFTAQALRMGYAIGMTREYAPQGPVAWYEAALRFAGITIPPQEEQDAANARLADVTDRNWELHGYQRVDPSAQAGPVNSALDLARLAGWVPRPPDDETSS